jgi:hypothetical protein
MLLSIFEQKDISAPNTAVTALLLYAAAAAASRALQLLLCVFL